MDHLVPHETVSDRPIPSSAIIGYKIVDCGQIVMNRMQASNGLFALAGDTGLVSPDYSVFQPVSRDTPDYMAMLFRSPAMRAQFRRYSKGLGTGTSGFLRLYGEQFGRIAVAIPPEEEQNRILGNVQNETANVDAVISRISREIDLIREYRSRLIADVVTGQLDVREAAAALPDIEDTEVDSLLTDAADLEESDDLTGEALDLVESADAAD